MTSISQWCTAPETQLPRERHHRDFREALRRLLTDYRTFSTTLSGGQLEQLVQNNATASQSLSDAILDAVDHYLSGHPNRAYDALARGISGVEFHLRALQATPVATAMPPFYRMRLSPVAQRWTPQDLFHIPFQARGNVASQGYSIQGLPC